MLIILFLWGLFMQFLWERIDVGIHVFFGNPIYQSFFWVLMTFYLKNTKCRRWGLNPRPFGTEPKSAALDHSATSTFLHFYISKFFEYP